MKTVEEIEVGDVVRVTIHLNDLFIKGAIYRLTSITRAHPMEITANDLFNFEEIFGSQSYKYPMNIFRYDLKNILELIEDEEDNIIINNCKIRKVNGKDKYYVEDIRESSEYRAIPTNNLTYEELSKLFKYIPVKYKKQLGFYYNGNIIIKVKPESKKIEYESYFDEIENRTNTRIKYIKNSYRSIIKYIPLESKEVSKYYSQEPLIESCKIKVTGYRQSSKFFQYSGEKKELLDKTLELYDKNQIDPYIKKLTFNIIEVKLKDKIKKSEELQNTISINGQTRKLRFVWDEIEIIYPNINSWKPTLKGFIKEGCKIKSRNKRKSRIINKNEFVVVNTMKKVGNKTYISFNYNNKQYYDNIRNYKLVNN